MVILMLICMQALQGAELKMPSTVRPEELFVVALQTNASDSIVSLRFDAARLEFLGAVQGTPEIQQKGDAEIEIRPAAGKSSGVYELKFLPHNGTASMMLKMIDASGLIHDYQISFSNTENAGGNSWIILIAALIFGLVGYKIWTYQKTAPEMMSTKSLFMNYEELEKARKQNFPEDESSKAVQPATDDASGQSAAGQSVEARLDTTGEVEEPVKPAPVVDTKGKKTVKHAAVKAPPLSDALSRLSEDAEPSGQKSEAPAPSEAPVIPPVPVPPPLPEKVAPATSQSSAKPESAGKKTVKNKAVVAPVLSGRLADEQENLAKAEPPVVPATPAPKIESAAKPEPAPDPKPAARPEIKAASPVMSVPVIPKPAPIEPEIPVLKAADAPKVEAPHQGGLVPHKERMVFAIEGNGKAYEAQGGIIRIGRSSENQICISASEVSRKHVEISVNNGVVSVTPLTETNSTRLNGRTVKDKQTIKPGDTLSLGGTDFVVVKARAL